MKTPESGAFPAPVTAEEGEAETAVPTHPETGRKPTTPRYPPLPPEPLSYFIYTSPERCF